MGVCGSKPRQVQPRAHIPLDPGEPGAAPLATLTEETPQDLMRQRYFIKEMVGKGAFGEVFKAVDLVTKERVAVKVLDRSNPKIHDRSINREESALRYAGHHENIVDFKGAYRTPSECSFVMELMEGGMLFDRLVGGGPYSEAEARRVFRQITHALAHIHERHIVHRDIKLENILLSDHTPNAVAKLTDFGLAQRRKETSKLTKVCGTWAYAAPEMHNHNRPGYDERFDMWSFGVILYIVLAGQHPFDPDGDLSVPEIKDRISRGFFDFRDKEWKNMSDSVQDLISRLLVVNPEHRLTSAQALAHDWFSDAEVSSEPIPAIDVRLRAARDELRRKMKAAAISALAVSSMRSASRLSVKSRKDSVQSRLSDFRGLDPLTSFGSKESASRASAGHVHIQNQRSVEEGKFSVSNPDSGLATLDLSLTTATAGDVTQTSATGHVQSPSKPGAPSYSGANSGRLPTIASAEGGGGTGGSGAARGSTSSNGRPQAVQWRAPSC